MADNAKSTDGLPTTSLFGQPLDWVWLGGTQRVGSPPQTKSARIDDARHRDRHRRHHVCHARGCPLTSNRLAGTECAIWQDWCPNCRSTLWQKKSLRLVVSPLRSPVAGRLPQDAPPPSRRTQSRWPVSLNAASTGPFGPKASLVIDAGSSRVRQLASTPTPSAHVSAALIGDT